MAHKQKYTKGSVGHILGHYDRTKEVPDLPMPDNTVLNYNLAEKDQPQKQLDFLHRRLSAVKVHNRKDVNVMVDWVVTAPKDLPVSDQEKFFCETYEFLNERYGKENVISSYVHMDETTPHMHYAFVPVVEDKKRGGYKLSAKEAVTREDLRSFHGDLSQHLEKAFRRDIGVLNEATKEGNKELHEMRRAARLVEAYKLQNDILSLEKRKNALQGKIEGLGRELEGKSLTLKKIEAIKPEKGFAGTVKNISLVDIDNLKKTALEWHAVKTENGQLREKIKELSAQIPSLADKKTAAKKYVRLEQLEKAFEKLPEDVREQLLHPGKEKRRAKGQSQER